VIVDAHLHIGTWEHPDFLGRSCSLADAALVLRELDIGGAAIVPTDQCDNAGLLAEARELLHAGDSTKWWFFPWVQIDDTMPTSLAWLEANAGAITGLKIHPSLSRRRIVDPEFASLLELAETRGWVVLVHCGRWQEMASYRFAVEAAERHPGGKFLLAHAGGDTPPLATAACDLVRERGVDNVWFEFSGVREYWVIERNAKVLGAERYLMGSDYNLAHPGMYLGAVRGMNLSDADKARILGENAVALFGPALGEAS